MITAPTAIPTSLAQLQEHMAVSAVPALSESDSKEGKKLYAHAYIYMQAAAINEKGIKIYSTTSLIY